MAYVAKIAFMVSEAEKRRVGALIRHRRQVLDIRQEEFAKRVGVSRNSVSNVENGRSYPLQWAGKAEAVLGISLTASDELDENEKTLMRLDLPPADRDKLLREYRALRNGAGNHSTPRRQRAG